MERATAEVNWRRKMIDQVGITYTPFAQVRGDVWQLNNFKDPSDPNKDSFVAEDTGARGIASGGVTISYPWVANTAGASHIIEPIGQIIVRQASVTQRQLPDEDAKSLIFDDTNLFEIQKFSGYDRIETGTRANVGLQYTFQANNGGYARFLAGQSYHLTGTNAYAEQGIDAAGNPIFNTTNGLETARSDYVLGVYLAPSDAFRIISQSRFDEADFGLAREDLGVALRLGPAQLSAVYTYARSDTVLGIVGQAQQDITGSLTLALTDRWSLTGTIRYDLDDSRLLTDSLQLKYSDECFMVAAVYSETYINDPARYLTPDRTIMLRFAWKYLGEYHYSTNVLDHLYGANAAQ